jgi:hypothetical protein
MSKLKRDLKQVDQLA